MTWPRDHTYLKRKWRQDYPANANWIGVVSVFKILETLGMKERKNPQPSLRHCTVCVHSRRKPGLWANIL